VVQRFLLHAKAHVTKDRYVNALDPAVVAAKKLEATLDIWPERTQSHQMS
jgi:hypothetical protein